MMSISLSTHVLHAASATERESNVRELVASLGAVVIQDDGRGIERRMRIRVGCWPAARRAWLAAAATDASHHLVLEDDAELCEGFFVHLKTAIASAPAACLSLFRGRRSCSVATVMPTSVLRAWLAWTSVRRVPTLPHHDWMIDEGMRALGAPHYATHPSIVDQRPFSSLLGHENIRALAFEASPARVVLEEV